MKPPIRPQARKGGITRAIRNAIEETDREFFNLAVSAIRNTDEPNAAIAVVYPAVNGIEKAFTKSLEQAWNDAQDKVTWSLSRRGRRILVHTSKRETENAALQILLEAEELVVPQASIDNYVNNYIPQLRRVLEQNRRELCRDIITRQLAAGNGISRITKDLKSEGFGNSNYHRETIARTEATTLYSHGTVGRYRASALVSGMQFDAIMDDRTSDICEALHGQIFRVDDVGGVTPPLHFSCRSDLLPVLFDEAPEEFDTAAQFLADEATPNPLPGFGNIDLSTWPEAKPLTELYKPLTFDQTNEMRELYSAIMGAAEKRWGPNWAS